MYKVKVIRGHPGSLDLTNSFLLKTYDWKDSDMGMVSLHLSREDASMQPQYGLLRLSRDFGMMFDFHIGLSRPYYMWFASPWRDKHDGVI